MTFGKEFTLIIVFLSFATLCIAIDVDLTAESMKCMYEDSECIANVINYLFHSKNSGDDSLNFVDMVDPLRISIIDLGGREETNVVNINCTLVNNELLGYHDINVYKVNGFGMDMTQKHEIYFTLRMISLIGDYDINGNILSYPIYGAGRSNMTMINVDVSVHFSGEPYEKEDGTYMKVHTLKTNTNAEGILFNFDNLFNGDVEQSNDMNAFLTEHWYLIYNELRPNFNTAFGMVFKDIINGVFGKHPYDQYFMD